jgi:sortase A
MHFLRYFGKFLISVGLGILLFVAWTLWGTGVFYTKGVQNDLAKAWDELPPLKGVVMTEDGFSGPPKNYSPGPGEAVFRMKIPALHLNDDKGFMVVEGVGVEDLKKGPGHYPTCRSGFERPLCTEFEEMWPGENGRVIVSGHRTTYLAPFNRINELRKGDEIITETKWGEFTYEVTETRIVAPDSLAIAIPSDTAEIVLTTCNPKYSASQRLIVFGTLVAP